MTGGMFGTSERRERLRIPPRLYMFHNRCEHISIYGYDIPPFGSGEWIDISWTNTTSDVDIGRCDV